MHLVLINFVHCKHSKYAGAGSETRFQSKQTLADMMSEFKVSLRILILSFLTMSFLTKCCPMRQSFYLNIYDLKVSRQAKKEIIQYFVITFAAKDLISFDCDLHFPPSEADRNRDVLDTTGCSL